MQKTLTPVKYRIKFRIIAWFAFLLLVGALGVWEIQTSRIQARIFSRIADSLTYKVDNGNSSAIRFPEHGPYDLRLGYARIPQWSEKMAAGGYAVTAQARWSPELLNYTDLGMFPLFPEKIQAGISIYDRQNREIMCTAFPQRSYENFDEIPPILIRMLLYIENRHLFDDSTPYRNPAIEWKRQGKALMDMAISAFDDTHKVVGGSTLATQIEKFRHSPEGNTANAAEKLRQIVSASIRAYKTGESTIEARKRIVLNYINSIPLAAAPGYGEVLGLGDGLWVWYGMEFDTVNPLLREVDLGVPALESREQTGAALKAALSIFLAQRRPSAYLLTDREALETLTNSHLRVMATEGLFSSAIRDAALAARPPFFKEAGISYSNDIPRQKAADLVRSRLLDKLDINGFYKLDRIDMAVKSTIDLDLQKKVTNLLMGLKDPKIVKKAGLLAPRLLKRGDPDKVVYSFSLYEKTPVGNLLRVQTNTYYGPFNIDEQTKLDLGSSAKLRTMIHYLEIFKEIHDVYGGIKNSELKKFSDENTLDPLTRWGINYLRNNPKRNLQAMLDAAMARRYSASPAKQFFTGGGLHKFVNFNRKDNSRVVSVHNALKSSINLVFIRMMRDIVYYHIFQRYGTTPRALEKIDESEKKRLLSAFADKEGIFFIRQFYEKYKEKSPEEVQELLFDGIRPRPARLTAAFRFLTPDLPLDAFSVFLKERLPGSKLTDSFIQKLYGNYSPGEFTLADIGYISNVHPLELWLVRYLLNNLQNNDKGNLHGKHRDNPDEDPKTTPGINIRQIIADSKDVRQEAYQWLFKTKSHRKQFQRIRTILELEAFQDIHRAWKNLGYPFDHLVPSYATSIGSSGDRPGSLAKLSGIILNNGILNPMVRVQSLHFAMNTPYETRLEQVGPVGKRVLAQEVAQTVKKAMLSVVAQGTARRLRDGLVLPEGQSVHIGGKTGTGDHRYKTFGPGAILISSRVVNRTAIFVFFIGDRFFGTITTHVTGENAGNYSFSSSLPVQVLKMMLPDIAVMWNTL